MLRLGLIGAGRVGRLHAENIIREVREAKLLALADAFMNEEMRKWALDLGIPKITDNAQEIFADPDIDAVLICSPTPTHEEYIIEAAKRGKHIFCEKPVGSDVTRIREALEVVDRSGVKLQVGFVRRFDHNHKKVHEAVRDGKIGRLYLVKITSRDPQPASLEYLRTSGGIFFDMTIHDFDMARYIAGSDVEEVFASGTVLVVPEIAAFGDFDTAIVVLRFTNGALGVIDNCREAVYGYDQRTEAHGSKGCIMVDNDRPNTSLLLTKDGGMTEKFLWFFVERYREAFIEEIRAFVRAVVEDQEPLVTGLDGLKAVLIAQAATASVREGRPIKVVKV